MAFILPFSNSSNIGYDYQTSDRSGTTNDYTVSGLASQMLKPVAQIIFAL